MLEEKKKFDLKDFITNFEKIKEISSK